MAARLSLAKQCRDISVPFHVGGTGYARVSGLIFTDARDLNGDGAIDWVTTSLRDGAPLWFDGKTGAAHQNRLLDELRPGDANRDLHFDEADLLAVAKAGRWQLSAQWDTGDWNGAPGGTVDSPPVGNGLFDEQDLSAALSANHYRKGPYASTKTPPENELEAMRLSLSSPDMTATYDALTGRLSLQADFRLTALRIHSRSGLFGSAPPVDLSPFDVATSHDVFRFDLLTFDASARTVQLPAQLTWEQVHEDLQIDGARSTGGALGNVRFTCTSCGLDVESVRKAVAAGAHARWSDLNGDAQTNADDLVYLLSERLQSSVGDADLNGRFDSKDLLQVFQRGQFDDTVDNNSTWADGDWNGDSEVDNGDLLFVFQNGSYADTRFPGAVTVGTDAFVGKSLQDACRCEPDLSDRGVADLDGDGDLDLVVSNYAEGAVSWYENLDGLGTFGTSHLVTSQIAGVYTAIATDLDGDGDLDVMASSPKSGRSEGEIVWYENVGGDALFASTPHRLTSPSGAYRLAMGDVDGDGDSDLIVGQSFSNDFGAVDWYANDGKGNFSSRQRLDAGFASRTLAVIDFNGDGDLDIFTTYYREFRWLENDGKGNFSKHTFGSPSLAEPFVPGDIDGDGQLEVLAITDDYTLSAFRYRNGTYESTPLYKSPTGITAVELGDGNSDGDLDIAVGNWQVDGAWLENTDGRGNFANTRSFDLVAYPRGLRLGDVDADGDKDIIDGSRWLENTGIMFGPGERIAHVSSTSQTIDVADFDGDQDLDIVAAYLLRNRNRSTSYDVAPLQATSSSTMATYLHDIDGDGDLDLVGKANYHVELYWRENENGEGLFGAPRWIRGKSSELDQMYGISFDDVDMDGDPDIVVGTVSRLIWLENTNGLGRFELDREQIIDGAGTKAVSMADLDGDGLRDLLTSQGWFRKLPEGGFAERVAYPDNALLDAVISSDLDLDGDLDLLATDSARTYVIENGSGGQLRTGSLLRTSATSQDVADLDLDGDLDILFINWAGGLGWLERLDDDFIYKAHALPGGNNVYATIAIDHDHDGDIDILSSAGSGIVLAENDRRRLV